MSIAELEDLDRDFIPAAPRRHTTYTTNAATTSYEDEYTPPPSGTDSEPESGPTLEELRIGHSGWQQSLWYVAHHANNEISGLRDIEAPTTDFDYTANHAATAAFAATLAELLPDATAAEDDFDYGGIFTVHHKRDLLFTEEREFRLQDLPRWKPHIVLDTHVPDDDDE